MVISMIYIDVDGLHIYTSLLLAVIGMVLQVTWYISFYQASILNFILSSEISYNFKLNICLSELFLNVFNQVNEYKNYLNYLQKTLCDKLLMKGDRSCLISDSCKVCIILHSLMDFNLVVVL